MARISPSRHLMYRCVWVPDGRAEPFFPLCPRRPCWTISPGAAAGLPPARVAASAPNDIIPTPSPRCGLSSPANCSGSCLTVPSAEPERAANLQHRHLLPRRRSVGGNGWALCARRLRATLHFAEFLQGNTTPVRRRAVGLQSTAALPGVLVAQHTNLALVIPAQPVRAEPPIAAVIDGSNRTLARPRPFGPVDKCPQPSGSSLGRHPSLHDTRPLPTSSMGSIIYNTVILELLP